MCESLYLSFRSEQLLAIYKDSHLFRFMLDNKIGKVFIIHRLSGLLEERYHGVRFGLAQFGLLFWLFIDLFVVSFGHIESSLVKIHSFSWQNALHLILK